MRQKIRENKIRFERREEGKKETNKDGEKRPKVQNKFVIYIIGGLYM